MDRAFVDQPSGRDLGLDPGHQLRTAPVATGLKPLPGSHNTHVILTTTLQLGHRSQEAVHSDRRYTFSKLKAVAQRRPGEAFQLRRCIQRRVLTQHRRNQ